MFFKMDSYIKLDSKTFFINDVFEAYEYFLIYSQKKMFLEIYFCQHSEK